jgi:hypothetical protein
MEPIDTFPDDAASCNPGKVICCIGAGYVGSTLASVLASHCPDYRIIVVDKGM